jgi:hypothetical protein
MEHSGLEKGGSLDHPWFPTIVGNGGFVAPSGMLAHRQVG